MEDVWCLFRILEFNKTPSPLKIVSGVSFFLSLRVRIFVILNIN